MNKEQELALNTAINEYENINFLSTGKNKTYPIDFKLKLSQLKELGIPVKILSETFKVPKTLFYEWSSYFKNNTNNLIQPKNLKLVSSMDDGGEYLLNSSDKIKIILKNKIEIEISRSCFDYNFFQILSHSGDNVC